MAKPKRIKPTDPQQAKKAKEGLRRKLSYLLPRKDSIEFTPPSETHWNRSLANHRPIEKMDATGKFSLQGNLGMVSRFFIPPAEQKRIHKLFDRFSIPVELHKDLTWSYLNMTFAGAEFLASDRFYVELDRSMSGLFKTFNFLKPLVDDEIIIEDITIRYRSVDPKKNKSFTKGLILKIAGPVGTGFIADTLKLYPQVGAFEALNSWYATEMEHGKSDMQMGHKNSQKKAQGYYARTINDFLHKNLFQGLRQFMDDREKLRTESVRLKKIFSDRQLYLFIGLLMQQSQLLSEKEDYSDESLIDLIKKKIIAAPPAAKPAPLKKAGKNNTSQ